MENRNTKPAAWAFWQKESSGDEWRDVCKVVAYLKGSFGICLKEPR